MLKRKQFYLLLTITFSILFLTGFASCQLDIEKPPKVETYLISVEKVGIPDNEFISLKTGEHLFVSCLYDDQRDNLPAVEVDMSHCNNVYGTSMAQFTALQSYCTDQATRLAICKKHPKQCK